MNQKVKEKAEEIISMYVESVPGTTREQAAHLGMLFVKYHINESAPYVNRVFWGNVNTYLCEVLSRKVVSPNMNNVKYMVCFRSNEHHDTLYVGSLFAVEGHDTLEEANNHIKRLGETPRQGDFLIFPYYEPEQRSASDLPEGQALPE